VERSAGKFNKCFACEVIIEAQALSAFISTRRLSSFICAVAAPAIHVVAARIIGASINIEQLD
jgi:hypothetical protein